MLLSKLWLLDLTLIITFQLSVLRLELISPSKIDSHIYHNVHYVNDYKEVKLWHSQNQDTYAHLHVIPGELKGCTCMLQECITSYIQVQMLHQ